MKEKRDTTQLAKLPAAPPLTGLPARKAKKAYLQALIQPNAQTSDALAAAGVTLGQVTHWRNTDPEFVTLESQTKLFKDDLLRRKIDEMVADGNEKIIQAAMKRLDEYNPTKHTEVNVKGEVRHKHLSGKSQQELDEIILAGAELVVDAEYEVVKQLPPGENHDDERDQENT